MSIQTLKRAVVLTSALFVAQSLSAAEPSARGGVRAAYNDATGTAILFGGTTASDAGSARSYVLDETWEWDGTRWIHRYPAHAPAPRFSHSMTYDSTRERIVLFGGTNGTDEFSDTWVYKDRDWTQIDTPNSPGGRIIPALAYDPIRDRVVLFGGIRLSEDKKSTVKLFDMWEFDGTTWTRIMESGPQVETPLLVWNDKTDRMQLLGHVEDVATRMHEYDPSAQSWNSITIDAATAPCVNESSAVFDPQTERVLVAGGVCVPKDTSKSSPTTEDVYAWDGETWTKLTASNASIRASNGVMFFDRARNQLVMFGGFTAYTSTPRSTTAVLISEGAWLFPTDESSPRGRSLFGMVTDPVNNVIWLVGGLSEFDYLTDVWKFADGFWQRVDVEGAPDCTTSTAAFDTNRAKLVVICADSSVFEFDNTAWKKFDSDEMKTKPANRNFASVVYDETLRKVVLFGGLDLNADYQNKTWTWDGTTWAEVKPSSKKRAHARALASMWFDPVLKKTVIFGGIGRREREGRLERYNDMWSFDGTGWTEIKPSTRPSTRYGAQVTADPRTNRTILHGGLRLEVDEKGLQRQVYADDVWEWDGTTWRQLQTEGPAPRRENAGIAWDPTGPGYILFGGWSGYFNSDTWRLADNRWTVFAE